MRLSLLPAGLAVALLASPLRAQAAEATIANALSAAPTSIRGGATVMAHDGTILRNGSGGWTCIPDMPEVPGNSPMCLDAQWLEVISAWRARKPPVVTRTGFAYMLVGDMPTSNVDPFATGPTPDNQWIEDSGPHLMLILPDTTALAGIPTDPANGGPWVMFAGTPFAHVMIPLGSDTSGAR